jgi:hypothetical protein
LKEQSRGAVFDGDSLNLRTGLLALLAVDASQGWEEGKGLGKDKQGIKSHIRVRKPREEKSGWLFIMLKFPPAPNFSVKSADCALQQYASEKSLWTPTPQSLNSESLKF